MLLFSVSMHFYFRVDGILVGSFCSLVKLCISFCFISYALLFSYLNTYIKLNKLKLHTKEHLKFKNFVEAFKPFSLLELTLLLDLIR